MIVVTFALPQESSDFRRELRRKVRCGRRWWSGRLDGRPVLVGHTGVGTEAASQEVGFALDKNRPDFVVSAGYAGGLEASLAVGDLVVSTNFSDSGLLERTRPALVSVPCFFGPLHTASTVAESIEEKRSLALATGALAVDMETSAIAAACRQAGVPLLSLRAISDTARCSLPVPFTHWFDPRSQRPRPFALIAYLASHPNRIAPFCAFVRGLGPARANLTQALVKVIASLPTQKDTLPLEPTRRAS